LILQKFLSIQFLLLLEFAAYKKEIIISFFIVQNISVASKTKQKREKRKAKKKCSKRGLLDSAAEN
jgi:hypothetical protein